MSVQANKNQREPVRGPGHFGTAEGTRARSQFGTENYFFTFFGYNDEDSRPDPRFRIERQINEVNVQDEFECRQPTPRWARPTIFEEYKPLNQQVEPSGIIQENNTMEQERRPIANNDITGGMGDANMRCRPDIRTIAEVELPSNSMGPQRQLHRSAATMRTTLTSSQRRPHVLSKKKTIAIALGVLLAIGCSIILLKIYWTPKRRNQALLSRMTNFW